MLLRKNIYAHTSLATILLQGACPRVDPSTSKRIRAKPDREGSCGCTEMVLISERRISSMKQYLSFGAGINSTALLLLLTDRREEFETVFINHGGDYPETYEYVDYLRSQGFEITEVLPDVCGYSSLYNYCYDHQIIPFRRFRWCTDKFKVTPFINYVKTPCITYLGFDMDEQHRATRRKPKRKKEHDMIYEYPLITAQMSRYDCIESITAHGLKIPPKSGCFFCPFMKRREIRDLYLYHPDLYEKAKALELNCRKRNGNRFLRDRPIEENALEHTPPLTGYFGDGDCDE